MKKAELERLVALLGQYTSVSVKDGELQIVHNGTNYFFIPIKKILSYEYEDSKILTIYFKFGYLKFYPSKSISFGIYFSG